ncbi:MAG: glycosyltransferase [Pyrobaculum sp.]
MFIGGRDVERHRKIAIGLSIDKNIKFLGCVGSHLKPSYYEAADIFVLPTLLENYSVALSEACAAGVLIVTTEVGGEAEIVKNMKRIC